MGYSINKTWPSGAQLTNYLSSFKKSDLLKHYAGLMMKAQTCMMNEKYDEADHHREKADQIFLYFQKHLDP